MQSHASASALLASCESVQTSAPLLAALGFGLPLIPLSRAHEQKLGLPAGLVNAHIANGAGGLRVLAFESAGELRSSLDAVARSLSARPSLMWLIVGISGDGTTAIAAVDASHTRARIASLTVQRSNVVASDAETACALAASATGPDMLVHVRWLEILGRDGVGRRFFRVLEEKVQQLSQSLDPMPSPAIARELALLYSSRLLFLSFLETRGWLDRDRAFLANSFADCMVQGGCYHRRALLPLFFGTLNTAPGRRAARARRFGRIPFLNGGLFARSNLEKRHSTSLFSDEALGDFHGDLLTRFRFTAREETQSWSESAIDPEMLGKAFEGLMQSNVRRSSGAFYTPQSLVAELTRTALLNALEAPGVDREVIAHALEGRRPPTGSREILVAKIDQLRILDPACGSGAFLVHVLEELSRLRTSLDDSQPLHHVRRRMLTSSIFGVDVNPTAVWLCELRLWLSMAIEDPEQDPLRVSPLPNLDRNIRAGDSLQGDDFRGSFVLETARKVTRLRAQYVRAAGPRKRTLARSLDDVERSSAVNAAARRLDGLLGERREALVAMRARDLFGGRAEPTGRAKARLKGLKESIEASREELRCLRNGGALAFSFTSSFADVYSAGGFDIVIGNPPWIRTHNLDAAKRARLRHKYNVYLHSAWRGGSDAAGAGKGFASQVDSAALFIERSVMLARPGGVIALIVPAKLWRSLAGGGVREFILGTTDLLQLHDLTGAPSIFDASVYPSAIVARRSSSAKTHCLHAVAHRDGQSVRWTTRATRIRFDGSPGSPWLLVPDNVRAGFDQLRKQGNRLSESGLGRPLLGVKTGCNDAFLIDGKLADENAIELTRPVLRGEKARAWKIEPDDARIIWTHASDGTPLRHLPERTAKWLGRRRRDLELRTDARGQMRWWSLFRTESADAAKPRVVWADIGRAPRAAVLLAGDPTVPLNTCYAVKCSVDREAFALAALMNSNVIGAWLSLLAEPARGGYRRYMGWTVALMPIPRNWLRAQEILAPIGEGAFNGVAPSAVDLDTSVLRAFDIDASAVANLLEWVD